MYYKILIYKILKIKYNIFVKYPKNMYNYYKNNYYRNEISITKI